MKKLLTFTLALALLTLSACAKNNSAQMTAQKRTELYSSAITAARTQEENDVFGLITSADDQDAELIFQLLGIAAGDLEAYAISVSPMNVKAYGIAAVMPAGDRDETVKSALQTFIDTQQANFEFYLPDQYEVAQNARLEALEDGTILMVMCEGQDAVYDSIAAAIQSK